MKKQETYKNLKTFMESGEYLHKRTLIQQEINNYPVKIDYSCFKKTIEEKVKLANEKLKYKQRIKKEGESSL